MQLVSTIFGTGPVLAKTIGKTFQIQRSPVKEKNDKVPQNSGDYAWLWVKTASSFEMLVIIIKKKIKILWITGLCFR